MQSIPCSFIEWSGFYAAWPKASRLNAVDSMHCDWMQCNPCSVVKCIAIVCSGFHAVWLNAVYSMQPGKMHPDWMQWIPCIVKKWNILNAVDIMQHDWMQWIPCSMIECSGFYAAWPKASWLNAVESMEHHWMQSIPCIEAQWIPILCSGVHAVWWMHGFHAAW